MGPPSRSYLVAYLDLNTGEVVEVVDTDIVPVPQERFDYHLDSWLPEPRTTQKTIEITQPEGASFTLDGDVLDWEKWQVRLGFDPVEGLVLHQISFDDEGERRPIVYRASVAGDGRPLRRSQSSALLAELLRRRRVLDGQERELARTRVRLPRRDPLLGCCARR